MSDPACESADCGAAVRFFPDQPPALDDANSLFADTTKLARIKIPDPHTSPRMSNRLRAIGLYRDRVRGEKLIEGWIEGPCAQGADLRGINTLMTDFFDNPGFVTDLFEFVTEMELRFARAQVEAGADMIGIGDAAASLVGPQIYAEFVWPYEKRMVDGIHSLGAKARLHICGNTRLSLDRIGKLGCDIVDLDYMVPVSEAREKMGPTQVLLGNLDPVRALRDSNPARVSSDIAECQRQAGPRYVVGTGCEVPRDTPEANLRALCRYAKGHG
jgi:MtaA/CmuA family methyltransferase